MLVNFPKYEGCFIRSRYSDNTLRGTKHVFLDILTERFGENTCFKDHPESCEKKM